MSLSLLLSAEERLSVLVTAEHFTVFFIIEETQGELFEQPWALSKQELLLFCVLSVMLSFRLFRCSFM